MKSIVQQVYLALAEFIVDREVEIHLDINPNELHGSSYAMQQAVGYIKGVCGHTLDLNHKHLLLVMLLID